MSTLRGRPGLGLPAAAIACTRRDSDRLFLMASTAGSVAMPAFASEHSAELDHGWPGSRPSLSCFSALWARPAPRLGGRPDAETRESRCSLLQTGAIPVNPAVLSPLLSLAPKASAEPSLSARMARWGAAIVLTYTLVALLTPVLIHLGVLADPNAGLANPIYAPPSLAHWCGTDRLGRDVCVRTLAGSGVALQVVAIALVLALLIGVPLGMVSGYLGGWVDRVLVLLMDTLYTLPVLLLSVVLAFLLGRGLPNAAAALCVVYVPQYFRVVRNQSAQVKAELFVEAARSLGAGPSWILRRYLLRNVITSVPVLLTLNAADAVLVLGGLGFLGLGLPETIPEWGGDLQQALTAVPTGIWWTALYPGLAMFVLVLGLSFLGEGLENWLSNTSPHSA